MDRKNKRERTIKSINMHLSSLQRHMERLSEISYKSGHKAACETIRVAIVQYALDNKISLETVQPYLDITLETEKEK